MKKVRYKKYSLEGFWKKFGKYIYYTFKDIQQYLKTGYRPFTEFGISMYCGRQGGGKTVGMTEYLERMRHKFPNVQIYTNYGYKHETAPFKDWNDFMNVRNGLDGVIFAIDEIQNEFSSTAWKNFPESLLSEITQQRKQRIKIVCTSQVFSRVAKPLREQCYEVIECVTLNNRWTFTKCFDADEYNAVIDMPNLKNKLRRRWRRNFVQDDYLRELNDSYAKIERMKKMTFERTT